MIRLEDSLGCEVLIYEVPIFKSRKGRREKMVCGPKERQRIRAIPIMLGT